MPRTSADAETARKLLEEQLSALAEDISSDLAELESTASKELLSDFVSQLFLLHAEQCRKKERRRKQAAGIAAAKAKGVRFGRPEAALPDNFDSVHTAWREGQMPLRQAADACGMNKSTFYHAAVRKEQSASPAV